MLPSGTVTQQDSLQLDSFNVEQRHSLLQNVNGGVVFSAVALAVGDMEVVIGNRMRVDIVLLRSATTGTMRLLSVG